jgi:hypothetical protein
MFIKIDNDETKSLIEEISAISGFSKEIIREVWEFTLFKWVEKITTNPKKLNTLVVPFLGKVGIRYEHDSIKEDGTLNTEVTSVISLDSTFKKLVGDIVDEGHSIITEALEKKIDNALMNVLDGLEPKKLKKASVS